jgi:uncharacterized membrane protein YfcA
MPIAHGTTLAVMAVLFVATLVRATFGFGEALVAVPLLALLIPVEVAAPVAALVSVTVAAVVIAQDWRAVHARSAGRLVLATLAGIPLGLWLLERVAEPLVKAILAVVILAFALHALGRGVRQRLGDDRWAWPFGLVAGVLGGAYGMNGPPLVIYGALRGWSPRHFRATLQGYFLPASLIGVAGYAATGLWTRAVSRYYVVSLPAIAAALVLGRVLHRRLDGPRFVRYVHLMLAAVGALLLAQAARG